jgi:CRP-like cAMP-binding protein
VTSQHFQTQPTFAETGDKFSVALANLYRQIEEMSPIEEPDWILFQQKIKWEAQPKNALLLRPGQVCDCIRFLHEGAVIYYDGVDEELQLEQVGWIAQPGELVMEINSFFQRTPTLTHLKCTVPCEFLTLSHSDLQTLYFESPAWNTIGRRWAEQYMLLMAERTHFHKLNSAEEKYRYFKERFPQTLQLVSQRHIAAFLHIRPETLSRLRRIRH